ncbi:MAG: TetR/AcrR family transcriptional regulator [Pseudomonadota bacterium]
MEAAKKLFYEKGFHATSLKDLAKEIGTTTGIIYYYFKSKEELLVRIYGDTLDETIDDLSKIAHSHMTTTEKMTEIIKYHGRFAMENQTWSKIFFEEESALPRDFQRLISTKKRQYNEIIEDLYSEGVREGVFNRTPDLKIFVNAILGMCNWAYKWYRLNEESDPEKISQQFADILAEGYSDSKKKDLDEEKETVLPGQGVTELSDVNSKFEEISSKIQIMNSVTESLAEKLDDIRKLLSNAIAKQNGV